MITPPPDSLAYANLMLTIIAVLLLLLLVRDLIDH
jgi:hypothetical protein